MTRTRPATRLDRPSDAPASPGRSPWTHPAHRSPSLGSDSGPPSPTTPPRPGGYAAENVASRAALLRRFLPRNLGGRLRGSSWSSGSGSDVPAAPAAPCARPPSGGPRACARWRPRARRRRRRATPRRARDDRPPARDARRDRARRDSADARLDALSRLYVAKFAEDASSGDRYRRARELVPGSEPRTDGETTGKRFFTKKSFPETRASRYASERARVGGGTTTSTLLFREARELVLGDDGDEALMTSSNVLRRNSVPTTRRKTTRDAKTSF